MSKKATVITAIVLCCLSLLLSSCNDSVKEPGTVTDSTTTGTENTTSAADESGGAPPRTDGAESAGSDEKPSDETDEANLIVQTAKALIGIPFAENGSTPADGFDNSGFIYYVLRQNGFVNCPRMTPDQAAMGAEIGYSDLKSGDLAFFSTGDSGNPDFGGIYIGAGKIIFSPMPGQKVREADITTDYWRGSFVKGVSLQNS